MILLLLGSMLSDPLHSIRKNAQTLDLLRIYHTVMDHIILLPLGLVSSDPLRIYCYKCHMILLPLGLVSSDSLHICRYECHMILLPLGLVSSDPLPIYCYECHVKYMYHIINSITRTKHT